MTSTKTPTATVENPPAFNDPKYYFNRELSWLEFNYRVLAEALDSRTPLLERLKFTAIFCSNLDEFFMVRVAGLKQQVEAEVTKISPDGKSPTQQLLEISQQLHPQIEKLTKNFETVLKKQLRANGIYFINYLDLDPEQRQYLENFFEEQIFPVLTPLAIDPSHPFPYISNLSFNLAVDIQDPETGEALFARVKVPKSLPRFVTLPEDLRRIPNGDKSPTWLGIPLEQVIAHNIQFLFPGMQVLESYWFRVTRNADLSVEEDEADDLLLAIEQELRNRRIGKSAVRLEAHALMPESMRERLRKGLALDPNDVYVIDGLLGLGDLMSLMGLPLPKLKDTPWTPVVPVAFQHLREVSSTDSTESASEGKDIFSLLREGDRLVHHPYHSFSATVLQLLTHAACDPDVQAIKMTLYRTSSDSPITQALMSAAENGKQVVALVELKARFDEENNINWARRLEQAGVHVVYGLVGLKTHTKIVLVVRREEAQIRRYVHVGTGNYNPKTAKLYTDLGLMTCRADIGADLSDLFNFLTGYSRQQTFKKLLVSPFNNRDRMLEMIRREQHHAQDGKPAHIIAKMNSLVDPPMIQALYEASQAGVEIQLIIRGICCLRPGLKGVSENIQVISIIGRFLEHSRIFYFANNGDDEVYIGSADWMPRNLNRRVEAITPVEAPELRQELKALLNLMWSDNRQAWELRSSGKFVQRKPPKEGPILSTHDQLMVHAYDSLNAITKKETT